LEKVMKNEISDDFPDDLRDVCKFYLHCNIINPVFFFLQIAFY
jgi:hypothetical protein